MSAECLPVRNVYHLLTRGNAKRIPLRERCREAVGKRTCPNRWTVLVEFATDPPTAAHFCEDHWAAARIDGSCP